MYLMTLLMLAVPLLSAPGGRQLDAEEAYDRVRRTPASELGEGLPSQPFGEWLAALLPDGAPIDWELNDCGEQSGDRDADQGRDIPACVEATAATTAGTTVGVQILVGTFERGFAEEPTVWSVYTARATSVQWLESLSALPGAIGGY